jgi:hypothetical protein
MPILLQWILLFVYLGILGAVSAFFNLTGGATA